MLSLFISPRYKSQALPTKAFVIAGVLTFLIAWSALINKELNDEREQIADAISSKISLLSNSLSLISNVKAVDLELTSADQRSIQFIFDTFVFGEPSVKGILFFDPQGQLKIRNELSSAGLYINEPNTTELVNTYSKVNIKSFDLRKMGQLRLGVVENLPWIVIEKTVDLEDKPLGKMVAFVDLPTLLSSKGKHWLNNFTLEFQEGTRKSNCGLLMIDASLNVCMPASLDMLANTALSSLIYVGGIAIVIIILMVIFIRLFFKPFRQLLIALDSSVRGIPVSVEPHAFIGPMKPLQRAFNEFVKTHEKNLSLRTIATESETKSLLARQVAHDIRSPLSALTMILGSLKELPEEKRLVIRNAAQRINDIANNLLAQDKSHSTPQIQSTPSKARLLEQEPTLLIALLDSIVSEKRTQFRDRLNVDIQADLLQGYGAFVRIDQTELGRTLSNLINNSVEAISDRGGVTVAIRVTHDKAMIIVSDDGKGIPEEIIHQLGNPGVTFGKDGTQSGNGLGLSHAKATAEKAGGTLAIQSRLGLGTIVTITLPKSHPPQWFIETLQMKSLSTIVSVDDDQTIHQIWAGRLRSLGPSASDIKHIRFTSIDVFRDWFRAEKPENTLFLVDYEFLGQKYDGLKLIEELNLRQNAILVSSRYEEPAVKEKCAMLGVKIIPKGLASIVPIEVEKPKAKLDAILIDDDESLVHTVWKMAAREKNKNIACFADENSFIERVEEFSKGTPVYVDLNLKNGVSGLNVASRLHDLGFRNIHIATGYDPHSIDRPKIIQSVNNKYFPPDL